MANSFGHLKDRAPIGWLRERDIDLLLCSELHADGPLRVAFGALWEGREVTFAGAWVSHAEFDGESDLVVQFSCDTQSLILLVENKIDAAFQPDQAARYAARAARWRDRNGVDVCTVLVCPEAYLSRDTATSFDVHFPYERIVTTLESAPDPRSRFLARCLLDGITAYRQGYTMVPDEGVTSIWSMIWELARQETPDLRMERPSNKPGGSTWVYFNRPVGFSVADQKRCVIALKADRGQVDLQFAAMAPDELAAALRGLPLPEGSQIVKAGKSSSLRTEVPAVDFGKPARGQEEAILSGLRWAERLRRLYVDHRIGQRLQPLS